jgi:crotonobetainyl-CoA:carnitine CoA-transferase CaiB-like acyl-CoA transferase
MTRDECAAKLRSANAAYGFVNDVAAFSRHPALRRVTLATPNGPVAAAAPAPRFSDGERALGPVPGLGEHTAAVRAEFPH